MGARSVLPEGAGWDRFRIGRLARANSCVLALVLGACGGDSRSSGGQRRGHDDTGGASGAGGTGNSGGRGGSSGTGDTGGAGGVADRCAETPIVQRRFVRLSTHQIVNSVSALVGAEVTARAIAMESIPPPSHRDFPPLAAIGNQIGAVDVGMIDRIGATVGKSTLDDFETVTGCNAPPTDACARDFVLDFAEKAYRRPLVEAEGENLLTVYTECKGFGGTVQEAVQHGVWTVLHSPSFLYRTEFGEGDVSEPEVALTAHEIASELSYFLTDGPPDEELLASASQGELSTADEIGAHALRLLETRAARANFESAMMSYFQIPGVEYIVIDPETVDGLTVNGGLLASMRREAELFFAGTLWTGELQDLLTSRRAFVNDQIAMPIYGVPTPTNVDADGFGVVELPEVRAGLLTSAPFLTSRTRPDGPSVVSRGLSVNAAIACQFNPAFPEGEDLPDTQPNPNASEREKAAWRAEQPLCAGCHAIFDPYGLALEIFDGVGRYRLVDAQGRPIDPVVTLPEAFGDRTVSGPAEMAAVIAESDVFKACVAMNYMNYAFADESQGSARAPAPDQPATSCAVQDVVRAFDEAGDPSFSGLLVQVARSRALRVRQGEP